MLRGGRVRMKHTQFQVSFVNVKYKLFCEKGYFVIVDRLISVHETKLQQYANDSLL